jgi:C1A family cysteine protease
MSCLIRESSVGLCTLAMFFFPPLLHSQTPAENPAPIVSYQEVQEKLCTSQARAGERNYKFRTLPRAPVDDSAYGRKPWYSSIKKIVPFWGSGLVEKYGVDDIRTMRADFGKEVPLGESERSKRIRQDAESKLKQPLEQSEQKWREWQVQNPDASADERRKAEIRIRLSGLDAASLPKFDWREYGLNIGEVGAQGFGCNTCWGFASVDAMQISRQLAAIRAERNDWDTSLRPSSRQLISHMVPQPDYCKFNWHGDAFTFMVDKGMPLGGSTKYVNEKYAWKRDATHFVRALTWDYVHSPPQNIAPTEEIKRAILMHGAVVSLLKFDNCLWLYGEGVFNETQNSLGSHLVVMIGWDDAKSAWLIKNSYSTEWGEGGFGWIKYGSNNIGQFAAWVTADPAEEDKLAKELSQNRER